MKYAIRHLSFLGLLLLMILVSSCSRTEAPKVMARYVPERMDDFVFENDLTIGRIYGKALEKETISPGIDIWVKMPGELVADTLYKQDLEQGLSYHKFHGLGKDCYKVSRSLGAGASALLLENRIQYPPTNYRSYELLEETDERVTFVLHYPEWVVDEEHMALDKKITIRSGSYFAKVEDTWTFSGPYGEKLHAAAGIFRHPSDNTIEKESLGKDTYAIWEHASDTGAEPEEGMIGIAVYLPGADYTTLSHGDDHGLCVRDITSGEPFVYYFGNCWSKAGVNSWEDWMGILEEFKKTAH